MTVTAIKMNNADLRGDSGALSPDFVLSKMIPLCLKLMSVLSSHLLRNQHRDASQGYSLPSKFMLREYSVLDGVARVEISRG
ncbi:MAG: hypothetical protein Q7T66_04250 [Herminiimonas sp.]|uniref:hypothetical protein n=1 Tax=Herminiimonas sp. TaxID=1926289 RepID=UPI00271F68FA|nr:hypothetical protein [Herminiimonas sp.]MDO9419855.1 hypothetical protein [Herminiimonas sp.]